MKSELFRFFMLIAILQPINLLAYDFEIDEIYYNIISPSSVEVCQNANYSGQINIPSIINYKGDDYNVVSIGEEAFFDCRDLETITIPNTVTNIGGYAFYGCLGLQSIVLPDSLISIGTNAFRSCSKLKSITIPRSVTNIGEDAFLLCSGLIHINVDTDNAYYDSRDNCNAIIETRSNSLIVGCASTTIPNTVTSIANAAFYGCSGLTSITIPNSVTHIGKYAFYNCSELISINLPDSIITIGYEVFANCHNLQSITIPKSVTNIYSDAFLDCTNLSTVTISNSTTCIDDGAFENCYNIERIYVMSDTPPKISSNTFSSIVYSNALLYIPEHCEETYRNALYWSQFFHLTGMSDSPVSRSCSSTTIYTMEGCTIKGQSIKNLSHGVYIVDGKKLKVR